MLGNALLHQTYRKGTEKQHRQQQQEGKAYERPSQPGRPQPA